MEKLQLHPGGLDERRAFGRLTRGSLELGFLGQSQRVHVLGDSHRIQCGHLQQVTAQLLRL